MKSFEVIFQYWWQFILIVCTLGIFLYLSGKGIKSFFESLKGIIGALLREPMLKTGPVRASIMNIVLVFFALIVTLILVAPNALNQLGFSVENNNFNVIVGVILLILVLLLSGTFVYKYEKEVYAFSDKQEEE